MSVARFLPGFLFLEGDSMNTEMKQIAEKREASVIAMREMVDLAKKEDRGFTAEERGKYDHIRSEVEGFDAKFDVAKADFEARKLEEDCYKQPDVDAKEERSEKATAKDAFNALIRSTSVGETGLSEEHRAALAEHRAQTTQTDSSGGYTIETEMGNRIIESMADYSGIRQAATVLSTAGGNPLTFPTNDDTSNTGAILAENTQDSEQDVTFGQKQLDAYKYTSKIIRVPYELLQDSAFDIEGFLVSKLGERLGRATSAHYATGTGSGQPQGLMTAATVGVNAASNTAITWSELLDLKHSVDPAYRRQGAVWAFNDTTLKEIKGFVDSQNRPLWLPSIAAGEPGTIDGDSYIIDQGIDSTVASGISVAYGNLNEFYIRDVMGVTLIRMVERYADYHQVGFVAIMRSDSELMNTSAVKTIQQSS